MLSFKQYLIEIAEWMGSSSFAISNRFGLEIHNPQSGEYPRDHPEAFPHLHFPGWAYHPSGWNDPNNKIPAKVWGRIDHKNKELHMTSPLIFGGDGELYGQGVSRAEFKRDILARMDALEQLRKQFPNHRIDTGMVDYSRPLDASGTRFARVYHGFDEHYKWLSGHLQRLDD